jgi:hypothetical protein
MRTGVSRSLLPNCPRYRSTASDMGGTAATLDVQSCAGGWVWIWVPPSAHLRQASGVLLTWSARGGRAAREAAAAAAAPPAAAAAAASPARPATCAGAGIRR